MTQTNGFLFWVKFALSLLLVLGAYDAAHSAYSDSASHAPVIPESTTQLLQVWPVQGRPDTFAQRWQRQRRSDGSLTVWQRKGSRFPVVVGRNGTVSASEKLEGDGRTPEGLYPLTQAFGKFYPESGVRLPFVLLTPEDKWIDDPVHPDYNRWIRGETTAKSFETLLRSDTAYDLFFVVAYNMDPVVPYKGSAIFVHLWSGPGQGTAGCVAMTRERIYNLATWLEPTRAPQILIDQRNPNHVSK